MILAARADPGKLGMEESPTALLAACTYNQENTQGFDKCRNQIYDWVAVKAFELSHQNMGV